MSWKSTVFGAYLNFFEKSLSLLSRENRNAVLLKLAAKADDTVATDTKMGKLHFSCPDKLSRWRADTLLTKEPETLEWLEGFDKDDVLWDIGANVGCYSLYAAKRGTRVVAFEPSYLNYYLLNKNIALNGLDREISAYCLALSDSGGPALLNLTTMDFGGALCSFGKGQDTVQVVEVKKDVVFKQGMYGISIDELVTQGDIPFPTHIKLDVDGIEDLIIKGAEKTLSDPRVKSVLMELDAEDKPYVERVEAVFDRAGLSLAYKAHSDMVAAGPFASVFNHIYTRKG